MVWVRYTQRAPFVRHNSSNEFKFFPLLLFVVFPFGPLSLDSTHCCMLFSFIFSSSTQNPYTEPSSRRLWYPFCFSNGTKKHFRMINIFNYRQTLWLFSSCAVFISRTEKFFVFPPSNSPPPWVERSIYIITIANISIWKQHFHSYSGTALHHWRREQKEKIYKIKRAISFGACCECGWAKSAARVVSILCHEIIHYYARELRRAAQLLDPNSSSKKNMYNHFVFLSLYKMGTKLKWNSQNKVISLYCSFIRIFFFCFSMKVY